MMSEEWTISIPSTKCPYRTQGGIEDTSANSILYTACAIMKKHSTIDICCYIRCPRR